MSHRLPPIAYVLGLGGVLPFIACGIAAVSVPVSSTIGLPALIAYGAVILSFLGAVHWGFALGVGAVPAHPGMTRRLALGVVPSLIGWAAVLLQIAAWPELALVLLVLGFIGTIAVEAGWARAGLVPDGYMPMRWALTTLVVVTLVTVLVLRLIGATILL